MFNRLLFLLLILPLIGSTIKDQNFVTITVAETSILVGTNASISIEIEVKEGYHIQANRVNDELLVPTTVDITQAEGFIIGKHEFPVAKEFKLEGSENVLLVYDGKFSIKLFLRPDTKTKIGKYILHGSLRYQACDSRSCLFPRTVDFLIPVEVKK